MSQKNEKNTKLLLIISEKKERLIVRADKKDVCVFNGRNSDRSFSI